jgi:hypothetical protein
MMQNLIGRIVPFIFLGIMIVIFVLGLILFSYVLIVGAIIGVALFFIAWLKEKFFPTKEIQKPPRGRTFEHDDRQ